MTMRPLGRRGVGGVTGVMLALAGCSSPLDRSAEEALREALIASHRAHLQAVSEAEAVELSRPASDVEQQLTPERRAELDRISGVNAYADMPLDVGVDLLGRTQAEVVQLSLQEAVELAVRHNLDVEVARLGPAIAETLLTQAEAVFDAAFFTTLDWSKLDTPRPASPTTGVASDERGERFALTTGIRKPLTSGGEASIETGIAREEPELGSFTADRFYDADVLLSISQPILRNFGADVNRAEILLAQSAQAVQVQQLKQQLLQTAFAVEEAYWNLVFARQQLLIQLRLLERTTADRDRLLKRAGFDVSPVQVTEANSFVELRRADVIRARQQVRLFSDALKQLINAPELAVVSETLVLPVDAPLDVPVTFSLLDVVTTALRQRPELQVALLDIQDASVRRRVAENARLPVLDLAAAVGLSGLSTRNAGDAYENLADLDFIDYLISAQFEVPIGNRGPEAFYAQRQLERRQSVLAYQREAQQTVLEVKNALRDVLTSYELIGATRAARRAAADNLRAVEEQEAAGVALTPEFLLDLKLQAQERLANAETQEIDALTQYMTSIADLYRVTGTLLERNQIEFVAQPSGR